MTLEFSGETIAKLTGVTHLPQVLVREYYYLWSLLTEHVQIIQAPFFSNSMRDSFGVFTFYEEVLLFNLNIYVCPIDKAEMILKLKA